MSELNTPYHAEDMDTLELRKVLADMCNCAYQQGKTDALDIDMDNPMHFTAEQKAWIKNYICINAERQRAEEREKVLKAVIDCGWNCEVHSDRALYEMVDGQLKEGEQNA